MRTLEAGRGQAGRWLALDRLRSVAVVAMIQGHTFSALLRPDELSPEAARWHALLHGLTAPAFLFGAGLAFGVTTYPAYGEHRTTRAVFHKRLRRYLVLLMLGYALQLPGGSLWAAFRVEGEQLALVCRVGPLQLVAVVLAIAQVAVLTLSTPRKHALLSAGVGLVVMFAATGVTRSILPGSLGPLLGAFVADGGGAHFPIFPWAAFVLFGIGCAGLRHARLGLVPAWGFGVVGALLAASAYAAYHAAAIQGEENWWWRTSPSYLLFRLGLVLLLVGSLHRRQDAAAPNASLGPSTLLARHSLVAYVAHLLLLFGTPLTPSIARTFDKSLRIGGACLACGLIVAATVGITWVWHWLEREKLLRTRYKHVGLLLFGFTLLVR